MIVHGIDLNSAAIREFCRKRRIKELSVFGSILRSDFGPSSDIDFLADFDEDAEWDLFDHMEMEDELARIVGRSVDLLTKLSVEASQNPYYMHEVFSTARQVSENR